MSHPEAKMHWAPVIPSRHSFSEFRRGGLRCAVANSMLAAGHAWPLRGADCAGHGAALVWMVRLQPWLRPDHRFRHERRGRRCVSQVTVQCNALCVIPQTGTGTGSTGDTAVPNSWLFSFRASRVAAEHRRQCAPLPSSLKRDGVLHLGSPCFSIGLCFLPVSFTEKKQKFKHKQGR